LGELNNKTIDEYERIKQLLQDNENKQKISTQLIGLFPVDVINIILSYTDNQIIFQLQDYFPNPLKYITINGNELELINKHNYGYIRKLNCEDCNKITNIGIKHLVNLILIFSYEIKLLQFSRYRAMGCPFGGLRLSKPLSLVLMFIPDTATNDRETLRSTFCEDYASGHIQIRIMGR
jgi:hypothetical protein